MPLALIRRGEHNTRATARKQSVLVGCHILKAVSPTSVKRSGLDSPVFYSNGALTEIISIYRILMPARNLRYSPIKRPIRLLANVPIRTRNLEEDVAAKGITANS